MSPVRLSVTYNSSVLDHLGPATLVDPTLAPWRNSPWRDLVLNNLKVVPFKSLTFGTQSYLALWWVLTGLLPVRLLQHLSVDLTCPSLGSECSFCWVYLLSPVCSSWHGPQWGERGKIVATCWCEPCPAQSSFYQSGQCQNLTAERDHQNWDTVGSKMRGWYE